MADDTNKAEYNFKKTCRDYFAQNAEAKGLKLVERFFDIYEDEVYKDSRDTITVVMQAPHQLARRTSIPTYDLPEFLQEEIRKPFRQQSNKMRPKSW